MSEGRGGPLSEPLLLPPQALRAAIRKPPVKIFHNKLAIVTNHRNAWLARQPGGLGSFVALERRGGGEDPWFCVPDFRQVCLYQRKYDRQVNAVNSGMYVSSASGQQQTSCSIVPQQQLPIVKRPLRDQISEVSGLTSAFIDSCLSDGRQSEILTGSLRPEADGWTAITRQYNPILCGQTSHARTSRQDLRRVTG